MNRTLLEQPFETHLVETRPGRFGKDLSVVASPAYVARLNEAFDGQWSFVVDDHHVVGDHVVVLGRLTADGVTKSAFGGASLSADDAADTRRHRLAEALEAASMDALKKAASLLGLGLHLYSDAPAKAPEHKRPAGAPRPVAPPATKRQRAAIDAITRALGWSSDTLHDLCLDVTGAPPGHLTKASASRLISSLQQLTMREAA